MITLEFVYFPHMQVRSAQVSAGQSSAEQHKAEQKRTSHENDYCNERRISLLTNNLSPHPRRIKETSV